MTDHRTIRYVVPDSLRWDGEIQKSFEECAPYHLRGLFPQIDGRAISVPLMGELDADFDPATVVATLVNDLARGMRDIVETIVEDHDSARTTLSSDPFAELIQSRDIVESSGGRYIYSGQFLTAMDRIDAAIKGYALACGAREEAYPATVPTAVLERSGYLKSFPQHAFFVSPTRLDQRSIEHVQHGLIAERIENATGDSVLQPPAETLAPTVCYHCFNARKDQGEQRPEVITAVNMCHRYEIANVRELERLKTFRMREIIYFGTPDAVQQGLDDCFRWFLDWLKAWDISFKATTANDPFFANSSDSKRFFQSVLVLKREVRLRIPKTGKWISVGSFNNHSDSLVKAFAIAGQGPDKVTSGCVGFGYERLLYGLMAVLGTDPDSWPWDKVPAFPVSQIR